MSSCAIYKQYFLFTMLAVVVFFLENLLPSKLLKPLKCLMDKMESAVMWELDQNVNANFTIFKKIIP